MPQQLEPRRLLADWLVNSFLDLPDATGLGDGIVDADPEQPGDQITLRAAVQEANALRGDDRIILPAGRFPLTATAADPDARPDAVGDLEISDRSGQLTVIGAGADQTVIDARGIDRIFEVEGDFIDASFATLVLRAATLTDGVGDREGGGAILNFGNLAMEDVVVQNSSAVFGGGIANRGQLEISRSAIVNNRAVDPDGEFTARGGGLDHTGFFLRMIDTTVARNTAGAVDQAAQGGGLFLASFFQDALSRVEWQNVTVAQNSANVAGGAFADPSVRVQLVNTLIAGNEATAAPETADLDGSFRSLGNNLIGDVGTATGFDQPTDLLGGAGRLPIDPRLGSLDLHGGTTPVFALLADSPAIDAGNNQFASDADQRGMPRIVDGNRDRLAIVDIGALEAAELPFLGELTGQVWIDRNGDGVTADDQPRSGAVVRLFADDGDSRLEEDQDLLITTVATDRDGIYRFPDLPPGTYLVSADVPNGWIATAGGDDFPAVAYYRITLGLDETRGGLDFAQFESIRLTGTVTEDVTGNGPSADDRPVRFAAVNILLDNGDGNLDPATDVFLARMETGPTGVFVSPPLGPGLYYVVLEPDPLVRQVGGGNNGELFYTVPATSGLDADVSFQVVVASTISGRVTQDVTGNGFSADDPPLPDISIDLYADNGDDVFDEQSDPRIDTTLSRADGMYVFSVFDIGALYVVQRPGEQFIQTAGGTADQPYYVVQTTSGSLRTGLDFTNARLAEIHGTIWDDRDRDRLRDDAGEPPLEDWEVVLTDGQGQEVARTRTHTQGEYEFLRLRPGEYSVATVPPSGWELTTPFGRFDTSTVLALSTEQPGVNTRTETTVPCGEVTNPLASIGGSVLLADTDGDGVVQPILVSDRPGLISQFERCDGSPWTFVEQRRLSAGSTSRPRAAVAADFNGDGLLDLAAAAFGLPGGTVNSGVPGNAVLVWFGTSGDAGFQPSSVRVAAGDGPFDLVSGDFNEDGAIDLATVNTRSQDVSILINNGSGRFAARKRFAQRGSTLTALAVGNLNGDQHLDLVVANYNAGKVIVLMGTGRATFTKGRVISGLNRPMDLALIDGDDDGVLDLFVVEHRSNRVSVYTGRGDGSFRLAQRVGIGRGPQSLAAADFNADGRVDIAVANANSGTVSVLYNTNGRFVSPVQFATPAANTRAGISPQSVAAGDVDGDGQADLVVAHYVGGGAVLLNRQAVYTVELAFGQVAERLDFGAFRVQLPAETVQQSDALAATPGVSEAPSFATNRASLRALAAPNDPASCNPDAQRAACLTFASDAAGAIPAGPRTGAGNKYEPLTMDTNGDGIISPIDALLVINKLNDTSDDDVPADVTAVGRPNRLDTSGDGIVSPIDALWIVNHLNGKSDSLAQGPRVTSEESSAGPESLIVRAADVMYALAGESCLAVKRRRNSCA